MHPLTVLLTVILAVWVSYYGVRQSTHSTSTHGNSRIKVDESACRRLEQVGHDFVKSITWVLGFTLPRLVPVTLATTNSKVQVIHNLSTQGG